ncbi:MAG: hypothetical protein V4648_02620 [Bacteroidota bacterium]
MKNQIKKIGLLLVAALVVTSCTNDDGTQNEIFRPSSGEWFALRNQALDNITQSFTLTAGTGAVTFTTVKGVQFTINGNCLTLNGNPVTSGQIDIEYAEVFDRGTMLVTDKTTMGKLPNGDMALIISGGEFYINATKNGQQLDITCSMQLIIPANLTGGLETGMSLWDGTIDENGNLDWDEQDTAGAPQGGVFGEGQGANAAYYAFLNDFGWTNVDRFYSDPRPKTTILAEVPSGYNFQNSAVYLHYDGEGSALAKLDTFNSTTNQFSEHYGQVPIGLQAHVIFVTEDNGNYKYAIKSVTVAAADVYIFTDGETAIGTEAQVIAAINALP